ncbi:STAS domain-containing protein [Caulobacter segnis]
MSDVGVRTISFAGEVTISNIGEAHQQLGALLCEQGAVVVAVEDLTETDLTFVQLLESARRKASENGVGLSFNTPASGHYWKSSGAAGSWMMKPRTAPSSGFKGSLNDRDPDRRRFRQHPSGDQDRP